jgi:hypothetical protein
MASKCRRDLLHKTKLEDFKKWCDEMGIPHRPGKGDWQVLQVCVEFFGWKVIHKRIDMPEHLTVDERLIPLVHKFIDSQKV